MEENKIIDLEEAKENIEKVIEAKEETVPEKLIEETEENATNLNKISIDNVTAAMKQMREMVLIFQNAWDSARQVYEVTEPQMRELFAYNNNHRISEEEWNKIHSTKEYDETNGIDDIPEEEIIRIFGEDHFVIGVDIEQTRDRVKAAFNDFYNWVYSLTHYENFEREYRELIEAQEEENMNQLKEIAEKEEDPFKKQKMTESLDLYYSNKYLTWLSDPLKESDIEVLAKAYADEKKITYWMNRSRDKLKQINMNSKFILQISKFEDRFLPEKYHKISGMFLLFTLRFITFTDCANKKNPDRAKLIAYIIAIDNVTRNIDNGHKDEILGNICNLLDQLIDKTIELNPTIYNKEESSEE